MTLYRNSQLVLSKTTIISDTKYHNLVQLCEVSEYNHFNQLEMLKDQVQLVHELLRSAKGLSTSSLVIELLKV